MGLSVPSALRASSRGPQAPVPSRELPQPVPSSSVPSRARVQLSPVPLSLRERAPLSLSLLSPVPSLSAALSRGRVVSSLPPEFRW
jgi:hypothetical protein